MADPAPSDPAPLRLRTAGGSRGSSRAEATIQPDPPGAGAADGGPDCDTQGQQRPTTPVQPLSRPQSRPQSVAFQVAPIQVAPAPRPPAPQAGPHPEPAALAGAAPLRPPSAAAHGVSFLEAALAVPRARHLPMSARMRQSLRRPEPQGSEPSFREQQAARRSLTRSATRPEALPEHAEEGEAAVRALASRPEFGKAQERGPHDPQGWCFTLLHYVALLGHTTLGEAVAEPREEQERFTRIALYLVKGQGAKVYVRDKYGCTPLQLAAACGNTAMVEVLLAPYGLQTDGKELVAAGTEEGRYLNNQDAQMRFTALHGAVSRAEHQAVVLLLRYGANPQVMDVTRKTAFKVAPSLGALQDLLQLLVDQENMVPMLVIVQLMAEVLEQEEAAAAKGAAAAKDAAAAAAAAAKGGAAAAAAPPAHLVQATIRLCFDGLYENELYDVIVKYIVTAVQANHYRLTELMVDLLMAGCTKVLHQWQWEAMLEPLVDAYPPAFHRLLSRLQEWRDDDVHGVVQMLVPASGARHQSSLPRQHSEPGTPRAAPAPHALANDQRPTNPAALTKAPSGALSGADTAGRRAIDSIAARVKLYQHLVLGLKKAPYRVIRIFFEKADPGLLRDMAQFPVFADFVGLLVAERQPAQPADRDRSKEDGQQQHHHDELLLQLLDPTPPEAGAKEGVEPSTPGCVEARQSGGGTMRSTTDFTDATARSSLGKASLSRFLDASRHFSSRVAPAPPPPADPAAVAAEVQQARLALKTLDVEPVLWAAVEGGKSHNVEAAVRSIVTRVRLDFTSDEKKAVFLKGVSSDMVRLLAFRFPSACAMLLNLVSSDIMERLEELQVPANVLYGKEHVVRCARVRNHFTWRSTELRTLDGMKPTGKEYTEEVIDGLIDYGVPFECVYKAAEQQTRTQEFAALIRKGFTGNELRQLISNGVALATVCEYIDECDKPLPEPLRDEVPPVTASKLKTPIAQLIRGMLRAGLNPERIIGTILDEGEMFTSTQMNNFRPGRPLLVEYPRPLFHPRYTHHFVQLFLTNWQRTAKDKEGGWTWDKGFIDTIFELNDPLCAKLKSAYDDRLTDVQVYLEDKGQAGEQQLPDREAMREQLLLSAFVRPFWLLHRMPVALLAWLILSVRRKLLPLLRWALAAGTSEEDERRELVDARALVIAWNDIANIGGDDDDPLAPAPAPPPGGSGRPAHRTQGLLEALVKADVPVRWFGFTAVKAVIAVHWQEFGQMLMLLSALAHIMFMVLFGVFMLLLRNAGEQEDGDMRKVRARPEVLALMLVMALLSVGGLSEELAQVNHLSWRTWYNYPGNLVDFTSFALFFAIVGMVWASYTYDVILAVCAIETLVLFMRLVFFASMTDSMGSLMRMVIEIIKDMRYFFLLLGMIFGGFAIAFAVLQGPANQYEGIALKLFSVMLGDWNADYLGDMLHVQGNWYVSQLSFVLMCVYGVLIVIVLVNLLIAIMNDTYDHIKETEKNQVLRNRARLIVDLQSMLTNAMRTRLEKRLLGDYLHVLLPADKVTLFTRSLDTLEGDWKGRMRANTQLHGIQDTCAMIQARIEAQAERDLSRHEESAAEIKAVRTELDFIKKWIEQQQKKA